MADSKKISQLHQIPSLDTDDEFLVVDKSTMNGPDASSSGKTTRVTFDQLKDAIGSQGEKGLRGEQGDKGNPGADSTVAGPRGLKGEPSNVPGPRGEDSTVAGPRGLKGEPSDVAGPRGLKGEPSTVKGPKGASSSVKGPQGPKGDKSTVKGPKGDKSTVKGPQGVKGKQGSVSSANYHLGLRGVNCAISYVGHHIYKLKGGNAWNAQVYSSQSYTGGCILSFSPYKFGQAIMMIGLDEQKPASGQTYQNIEHKFYLNVKNPIQMQSPGKTQNYSINNVNDDSVFTIEYDNQNINYYVDGAIAHVVSVGPNKRFYLHASIYGPTSSGTPVTSMLSFNPLQPGAKGQKGDKSTSKGPKGNVGAKSTIKGPKGPEGKASTVKGQKGERGVTFSFSNGTLKITS